MNGLQYLIISITETNTKSIFYKMKRVIILGININKHYWKVTIQETLSVKASKRRIDQKTLNL